MKRLLYTLLALAVVLPASALADSNNGRRLDAIATGRLYDPILTPQLNPDFELLDPSAEAALLRDIRDGRVDLNRMPEAQRQYYMDRLDSVR